ncbi:unnamed protein product [Boreogadus saida]
MSKQFMNLDRKCPFLTSCVRVSLQNCGRRPEDVLNPAPYVTYQPICSMETFSQPAPPPAAAHPQPPTSFLPQHPYAHPHRPMHQQPPGQEISYPPNMGHPVPGPRAPFTYSREQSV